MAWASILSGATDIVSESISGIVTGVAGYFMQEEQAENKESIAEQERLNAKRAEEAAHQKAVGIEQKQAAEERIQREKNKALLARNRARIGMGGLDYSGSPLLVEIDNAMNMEMDIQNERIAAENAVKEAQYEGHLLSLSHYNKANEHEYAAGKLRRAAEASALSAAAVGLEGFTPGIKDAANAYAGAVGGHYSGSPINGASSLAKGIGSYSLGKKASSNKLVTGVK